MTSESLQQMTLEQETHNNNNNDNNNNNKDCDNKNDDDSTKEMMRRLQSQFGDLDLSTLLLNDGAAATNNINSNGTTTSDSEEEEEESLQEPTPEELQAWQQAQFQKGRQQKEQKKAEKLSLAQAALRKRRQLAASAATRRAQHNRVHSSASASSGMGGDHVDDDEEDWEKIAALPDLNGQSSAFFPSCDKQGNEIVGVHPILQRLATDGDAEVLGTTWKRLYSSAAGDGLSFYNLVHTIQGYTGPTLMLIGTVPSASKTITATTNTSKHQTKTTTSTTGTTTIGFFTTSPWIMSPFYNGTSDCFLCAFQEDSDQVSIVRPRAPTVGQATMDSANGNPTPPQKEQHYMYCYPSFPTSVSTPTTLASAAAASTGAATSHPANCKPKNASNAAMHGIGIGGTPSAPRLHLTESLENCRALDYCTLFEPSDLLLGQGKDCLNYFDVDCLEVWAVGGMEWIQESIQEQKQQMDIATANLQKARKVDKKQFLQDFKAGIHQLHGGGGGMLFGGNNSNGLFAHHDIITERCDV